MIQHHLSTTIDTNSTTSYGKSSISWSSWSTGSTIPYEDMEDTADIPECSSDSDTAKCAEEYLNPACPTLRSLSSTEKSLRKTCSFIGGASDFGGCEDRRVDSNRLEDIIACSKSGGQKFLVFSSSFPYHIEWANCEWSKVSGWSSDEVLGTSSCVRKRTFMIETFCLKTDVSLAHSILGLDCQFLQGDATDKSEITKFWQDLSTSDGYASLEILNYNKYDTLHHNSLHCFPLIDNCGPNDAPQVSHIAVVLTGSYEVHHSAECSDLLDGRVLEEVGMPLDRREGCVLVVLRMHHPILFIYLLLIETPFNPILINRCGAYPHANALPPPPLSNWLSLTDGLPLALMLRYMLRSQAAIVLLDR